MSTAKVRLWGFVGAVVLSIPLIAADQKPSYSGDVAALREYVDIRFDAQQKAVDKAEAAADKRFESVNEFRKQLGDQSNTFLTRAEYDQAHKALDDKSTGLSKNLQGQVTDLTTRIAAIEGHSASSTSTWGYIIGVIGLGAT